eukprot:3665336-Alexandrium_andersonii.AAC.1
MLLSQSLDVGPPQGRLDIAEDLEGLTAQWHSVVISDSTVFCVKSKSDLKYPKCLAFSQPALER